METSLAKVASKVVQEVRSARDKPHCYFCNVPVEGREYVVKLRKPMEIFLQLNPQWLSFGKVFDDKSRLCNQGYCLGAAFENWRLDSFGIKSPRGQRPPRLLLDDEANDLQNEEASVSTSQVAPSDGTGHPETHEAKEEVGDLLLRTGASLASLPIEVQVQVSSRDMTTADVQHQSQHHDKDDFYDVLEGKRAVLERVRDRTSDLDKNSTQLSEQLRSNREERLKVARRLQEMREKQPELEMRKLEREKEQILTRKREIYKQVLQARLEKEEAQAKVDRLDLEQRVALLKIEEYNRLRKLDEAAQAEGKASTQSKLREGLEPAMKHLSHVGTAKDILESRLGAEDGDEVNSTAITQELQHALREAYVKRKEELLSERSQLTSDRFQLESRLGQLKEQEKTEDGDINDGAGAKQGEESDDDDQGDERLQDDHNDALNDDEPFEAAYALADKMHEISAENTQKLMQRLVRSREETFWLDDYPDTAHWQEIHKRALDDCASAGQRKELNSLLAKFFENYKEKAAHENKVKEEQARDSAILQVSQEILWELCKDMVTSAYESYRKRSKKITSVLDNTVIDVLYGTGKGQKYEIYMSGREFLAHGLITELRSDCYVKSADTTRGQAIYDVNVSQENCINGMVDRAFGMGFSWNRAADPREEWFLKSDKVLSINQHHEHGEVEDDRLRAAPIAQAEHRHWDGVYLTRAPTTPLMMPNIKGRIDFMRLFYRKFSGSSMLFVSVHTGQFACWNVPHPSLERSAVDGGEGEIVEPEYQPPVLVSISPQLDAVDSCSIVECREGSLGSLTLITLYANGHVRVWDMNPVSVAGRRKGSDHLRAMFPTDPVTSYVPTVPSVIFHINPLDCSLPGLNPEKEGKFMNFREAMTFNNIHREQIERNKLREKRRKPFAGSAAPGETAAKEHLEEPGALFGTRKVRIPPQPGKFPCQVAFHPSLTLCGRNPSIMVGTEGGDLLKFNMDFRVNDLDAPIINIQPFVEFEFVHPMNASALTTDIYLNPSKKDRKGNRVYRELFYYHKSPIVFLGALHRHSNELVSIDEDGYMALWEYTKEAYKGTACFRPKRTRRLDMDYLKTIKRYRATEDNLQPTPLQQRHLRVRVRECVKEKKQDISLYAHLTEREEEEEEYIKEIYYPLLATDGTKRFVEFTSLTRHVREASSEVGDVSSIAMSYLGRGDAVQGVLGAKFDEDAAMGITGDDFSISDPEKESRPDDPDDMSALTGGASLGDTGDMSASGGLGMPLKTSGPALGDGNKGDTKHEDESGIAVTAWDAGSETGGSQVDQRHVKWSSQFVEELRHSTEILDIEHPVQMSEDGSEIYVALTYREDNKLSKDMIGQDPYTDYILFVRVTLDDLDFKLPFTKFPLKANEELYMFTPGPILEETLTRVMFAHTNSGTRIFSLESGEEIYTFGAGKGQGNFPYTSSEVGFKSRLMALCPSQRVLVYGGPTDNRIEVNFFGHTLDGIDDEGAEDLSLKAEPTNDYIHYKESLLAREQRGHLHEDPNMLLKKSMRSVLVNAVEPDLKRKAAKAEAEATIAYLWEVFCVTLEKKDDAVRRKQVATDVYGSNTGLGTIRPTHWPPAGLEKPYHYESFDANKVVLKEPDDSSDEDSAGEVEAGPGLPPPGARTNADVFDSDSYKQTELLDSFERWRGHSNFKLEQPWEGSYKNDPFLISIAQEEETLLKVAEEQKKERVEHQAIVEATKEQP